MKPPEKTRSNMRKTIVRKLSFFKKALTGFISRLKKRLPKEFPTGKYYRAIDEMPLRVFITILCTDRLKAMVYEGTVPETLLKETWDRILSEYLDATFSEEDRHLIQLISSANLLEFNITKATAIQRYLVFRYDEEMIAILRKIGAADGPYPTGGTEYAKLLWAKRVTAKIKKWQHTLRELTLEIKKISPAAETDNLPKVSRKYFDDILSRLSQHFHYHVDENTVTVSRYLSMLNDYKDYLTALKKQANKTTI